MRPRHPPTSRPFLRAKIIKSYVYLSVILWYPTLQVSSGQFTVFDSSFYAVYSIPQTFKVYQTLAIFLLAIFFAMFFTGLPLTIFRHIFLKLKRYFPDLLPNVLD